ncbi:hypothetical protein AGLY_006834, partial [Aphis glycines]
MCVFFVFVSMITITYRNNASLTNFEGGFRRQSEYPWYIKQAKIFKKIEKNKKKNDGKTKIFTQNQFSTESIFLYGCNSKTNHCKYLKFSPNIYVSVIYILLNFQKILTFFDVGKKILDDQKNLKIQYKVPYELFLFSNFYEICRKRENLQVILKENSKHHYRKNFNVDKIFLAQSKYLKILYKVPHMAKTTEIFEFS